MINWLYRLKNTIPKTQRDAYIKVLFWSNHINDQSKRIHLWHDSYKMHQKRNDKYFCFLGFVICDLCEMSMGDPMLSDLCICVWKIIDLHESRKCWCQNWIQNCNIRLWCVMCGMLSERHGCWAVASILYCLCSIWKVLVPWSATSFGSVVASVWASWC